MGDDVDFGIYTAYTVKMILHISAIADTDDTISSYLHV
jgi:hypothetical protein